MNDNLATFLIMVVSVAAAVTLVVLTKLIGARQVAARGAAAEAGQLAAGQVELLSEENERLHGQIGRLEERLAVLERIATDPAERTAREIEQLR